MVAGRKVSLRNIKGKSEEPARELSRDNTETKGLVSKSRENATLLFKKVNEGVTLRGSHYWGEILLQQI